MVVTLRLDKVSCLTILSQATSACGPNDVEPFDSVSLCNWRSICAWWSQHNANSCYRSCTLFSYYKWIHHKLTAVCSFDFAWMPTRLRLIEKWKKEGKENSWKTFCLTWIRENTRKLRLENIFFTRATFDLREVEKGEVEKGEAKRFQRSQGIKVNRVKSSRRLSRSFQFIFTKFLWKMDSFSVRFAISISIFSLPRRSFRDWIWKCEKRCSWKGRKVITRESFILPDTLNTFYRLPIPSASHLVVIFITLEIVAIKYFRTDLSRELLRKSRRFETWALCDFPRRIFFDSINVNLSLIILTIALPLTLQNLHRFNFTARHSDTQFEIKLIHSTVKGNLFCWTL